MLLVAPERYGEFYTNAIDVNQLLQHSIIGVDQNNHVFAMFASQARNYHLLAIFSFVRLHQVQGKMNLRQVLEAGAFAAYYIHNKDISNFTDQNGNILKVPKSKSDRMYKWLKKDQPNFSQNIYNMKKKINEYNAHSNILGASNHFQVKENEFGTTFFDNEDDYFVKIDLWSVADAGLRIIEGLHKINNGKKNLTFANDFEENLCILDKKHQKLKNEVTQTERYKKAMLLTPKTNL